VRRRPWRLLVAAALVGVACGCSTLPDSGEVHTRAAGAEENTSQAPDFAPPGPSAGDTQEGIVRGFLLAMQANPPSTAVARSFLSNRAKSTWRPDQGTIVYDAPTVSTAEGQVVARLRGAHRLSPEGVWLDGTTSSTTTLPLTLVSEGGQWRIDNPPNALAVPSSYFSSLFVPFDLYWFDRTGTVLVPTKVYVPRGEQTATNLVRGLLAGPPPAQRAAVVSAVPARTELDPIVVVNDAGIAEVPLDPAVLRLAPAELSRAVAQLASTLRQVPGINRMRITVDGAPVSLSAGRSDVSVAEGAEYDPLISAQRDLLAISAGRVVRNDGEKSTTVGGPFGQPGFALRSLAWDARDHLIAAVSGNGRRVFVGPDRGGRSAGRVRTVLDGGTDVLRPSYDRFGGLWLVDNGRRGAVIHHIDGDLDVVVRVPGVSSRRIGAFTVTRDGTALVAVLTNGTNPTVMVGSIVRDALGHVERVAAVRTLQITGVDLGPAHDVAQYAATSVAVLTRPATGPDQIVYVELDGSPGPQASQGASAPETVPGPLDSLVASPDPALPLEVVSADRHLFAYEGERWVRAALPAVVAATYAQ
jgi:hypothetical protein